MLGGKHLARCPPDGLLLSSFAVEVGSPVLHQRAPAFEQVRAGKGHFDSVADRMRRGQVDHLPGMVRLPKNSVKVFTGLYLYRMERPMVPL